MHSHVPAEVMIGKHKLTEPWQGSKVELSGGMVAVRQTLEYIIVNFPCNINHL